MWAMIEKLRICAWSIRGYSLEGVLMRASLRRSGGSPTRPRSLGISHGNAPAFAPAACPGGRECLAAQARHSRLGRSSSGAVLDWIAGRVSYPPGLSMGPVAGLGHIDLAGGACDLAQARPNCERIRRLTWWASGTRIARTAREYSHRPAAAAAPTET